MQDLVGKVAFVTGAASGIGLGIAEALAQAGVKVMMADIEQDALDREVARLAATNADVAGVRADVSLKDELQRAADADWKKPDSPNVPASLRARLHAPTPLRATGPGGTWRAGALPRAALPVRSFQHRS